MMTSGRVRAIWSCLVLLLLVNSVNAVQSVPVQVTDQEAVIVSGNLTRHKHHNHAMKVSPQGMVMNHNSDVLPWDCAEISTDIKLVVRAGRAYARQTPGRVFGMSQYEYRVPPCARVSVQFINEDDVRHQWMVHGLPDYLYPKAMFHLEAMAGQTISGTFIVPGDDKTYLVHCDMAQHMEKGMKGQLIVGAGSGDLWGIFDQSENFRRSSYLPDFTFMVITGVFLMVFSLGLWARRRFSAKDPFQPF